MSSQSHEKERKLGAFTPINTLNASNEPKFPLQQVSINSAPHATMVNQREPPRFNSPRKPLSTANMAPEPGQNSSNSQNYTSASFGASSVSTNKPVSKVPHDQTLVAQKIRDGADPYAQKPSFERTSSAAQKSNSHVFNVPNSKKPRPEHHRNPSQTSTNQGYSTLAGQQRGMTFCQLNFCQNLEPLKTHESHD